MVDIILTLLLGALFLSCACFFAIQVWQGVTGIIDERRNRKNCSRRW